MDAFMTLAMGITLSFVMGTHGVVASGHFTIPMWLLSLALSIPLALAIGFLIPIRKMNQALTKKIENKIAKVLVSAVVTNLFYVGIITTVLTIVMIGNANGQITKGIIKQQEAMERMETEADTLQHKMDSLETDDPQYIGLGEQVKAIRGQKKQMQDNISQTQKHRPSVARSLPKSLVSSFLLSYILSILVEPLYVRIGMKKYGLGPYANGKRKGEKRS